MQRARIALMIYWLIFTYVGFATVLKGYGVSSLPLSLAGDGDFMSLLAGALVLIIFAAIGQVAGRYLIHRRRKQSQKTSQPTPVLT